MTPKPAAAPTCKDFSVASREAQGKDGVQLVGDCFSLWPTPGVLPFSWGSGSLGNHTSQIWKDLT